MQLFKSLLLGISLAIIVVDALPFPDRASKFHDAEQYQELLPRASHYPAHGTYSKKDAVKFVKGIPDDKLRGFGTGAGTIYTDGAGKKSAQDGHRLDMQGMAQGHHNIQVQINGGRNGKKTTVGGLLVKGTWSAKRTKKELIHSIMHPPKDKEGNEYLRKQKEHPSRQRNPASIRRNRVAARSSRRAANKAARQRTGVV